jgi:hypothetical protein
MDQQIFFQEQFAVNNNWGNVVGFDEDNLLLLNKTNDQEWELQEVPHAEVHHIHARQYRSIYALVLGLGAASIAAFIAYCGITGEITGLGVLTLPLVLGAFAYFAFTGSKVIRIDFETRDKGLCYKSSSYSETLLVIPDLQQWADGHNIQMNISFSVSPNRDS